MITEVEILDADYSGLESRFPQGSRLATDSGIVLLVGPNNIGKTALLRMLATSLDFERYYRSQGISHFWDYSADGIEQSVSKVIADLRTAEEFEEGWFVFDPKHYRDAFNRLCEHLGQSYSDQVRPIDNSDGRYPGYTTSFYTISEEGRTRIFALEGLLKEGTDTNIWGFVKPTIAGEGGIFVQHLDLPQDDITAHEQQVGLRRYVHFANRDDYYFGELKPSPGHTLYQRLEALFDRQIRRFFEEHVSPRWERADYSQEGRIRQAFSLTAERPMDEVPDDARLCVIMEEPTIFLDAVNTFRFQRMMKEALDRYPGRLQFFIASNDYGLISGLAGSCTYINMYEQPVLSSRTFDVQDYL